jgi:hypothetical protein
VNMGCNTCPIGFGNCGRKYKSHDETGFCVIEHMKKKTII